MVGGMMHITLCIDARHSCAAAGRRASALVYQLLN